MRAMSVSVIIPTLNAGERIDRLLDAVAKQTLSPEEIIVVDSQSDDGTASRAAAHPRVRVVPIARGAFDHGGTRDMALRLSHGDFVVFLTQDALPVGNDCLERLMAPFKDPGVAAVGGRQIAYPEARPFERMIRAHNYPAESRVWRAEDISRLGVRAYLISDVCAAYRREAYLSVGGFDHPIMTNEDMLMAQKLLGAGFALAYSAEAAVYHSHRLTWRQEFRRNWVIGRTMKRYERRFQCGSEMSEGITLVKSVLAQLMENGQLAECAGFCLNCSARLLGNRLGRWAESRRGSERVENE